MSERNSYKEICEKFTTLILSDKELFLLLLKISFDVDNQIVIKASWILEFVLREKLY